MINRHLLDARHQVASAAGTIAHASAQVSRALAWSGVPKHSAALASDLGVAIEALEHAKRQLIEARTRVQIADAAATENITGTSQEPSSELRQPSGDGRDDCG